MGIRRIAFDMLLFFFAALCVFAMLFTVMATVFCALEYFDAGIAFTKSAAISSQAGLLPQLISTAAVCLSAVVLALPVGIAVALFLLRKNGHAQKGVTTAVSCMAAIPSAVYGLFGMLVFSNLLGLGFSVLSGIFTLAVLLLPAAIFYTKEEIEKAQEKALPATRALGATEGEAQLKMVLVCAKKGLCSACVFCICRAMGDTAALIFTLGVGSAMPTDGIGEYLLSSAATLAVGLYRSVLEGEIGAAFVSAVILLLLTFLCDFLAAVLGGRE